MKAATALAALMLPWATVCAALSLEPTVVLSGRSTDNRHPVIAASSDGAHAFAAWDGIVGEPRFQVSGADATGSAGGRRILVRESVAGEWLPEVIADELPGSTNSSPSLAVDASGNPHVAWIANDGGHVTPRYAMRVGGKWISFALPEASISGDCDYVSLKLDDAGRPFLVWQSGHGNIYEIWFAYFDAEGKLQSESLTPHANGHNLFPEIVFDPEPVVLWYAARDSEFYLVGERFVRSDSRWEEWKIENLAKLPAGSLPYLSRTPGGALAAFWPQRPESSAADRVYVGMQNAATQCAGVVVDTDPTSNKRHVFGIAARDLLCLTWCSESADRGAQILAGIGKSPDAMVTVNLTGNATSHYANPKLVREGFAKVGVVWESCLSEGGDGSIFYRAVSLGQSTFEPRVTRGF